MRSSFHKAGRERRTRRSRSFFKATRLRNALNFSGSFPIASSSATNAIGYAKERERSANFIIKHESPHHFGLTSSRAFAETLSLRVTI